jgi:hypothetical protein
MNVESSNNIGKHVLPQEGGVMLDVEVMMGSRRD